MHEDGFEYDGQVFRSLSAIAKLITGSHWNGLLFFKIAKPKAAQVVGAAKPMNEPAAGAGESVTEPAADVAITKGRREAARA